MGVRGVRFVSILGFWTFQNIGNYHNYGKHIEQLETVGVRGVCCVSMFGFGTFQNIGKIDNYEQMTNWVFVVFVLFQCLDLGRSRIWGNMKIIETKDKLERLGVSGVCVVFHNM